MNKLLTKIVGVVLGTTMAVGVGVGVAVNSDRANVDSQVKAAPGDTAKYEFHFASGAGNTWGTSSSGSSGTKFRDVTWVTTLTNAGSYQSSYAGQQFGTSSSSGKVIAETLNNWGEESGSSSFFGKTEISSIVLWLNNGSGTINTYDVKIGGVSCSKSGTISKNTSANGDYSKTSAVTYTPTSGNNSGKVRIEVSTSSKAFYFAGVDINCVEPDSPGTKYTVTYAVGDTTKGQYDGSTPRTFEVAENASHALKTPAEVGMSAKTGYGFKCWNDGTSDVSGSITVTGDVNLTAQWSKKYYILYTVNLDAYTGEDIDPVEALEGESVVLPTPSQDGYLFQGWATSESGSVAYAGGATITNINDDYDLYGVWIIDTSITINSTTFTKLDTGSGYTPYNGTRTIGGVSIYSYQVMVQSNSIQFQSNAGWIKNTTAVPGLISKITLASSTNLTIYVGTSEFASKPSSGTTVSSGVSIVGSYQYFAIVGGSSTPATATIKVEYSNDPAITITSSISYFKTVGSTSKITADVVNKATGVSYTCVFASSDPTVATINSSTGDIEAKGVGETTITVSEQNSKAIQAQLNFKVLSAHTGLSIQSPLNVTEALNFINNLDSSELENSFYVGGILTIVDTETYSKADYYFGSDTHPFNVYGGTFAEGYSASDMKVGNSVIAYGIISDSTDYIEVSNAQIVDVSLPELVSISFTNASMTTTTYSSKDASWDVSGLVVNATFDNESVQDVTDSVEWSFSVFAPSSVSFDSEESKMFNLTVTASFNGKTANKVVSVTVTNDGMTIHSADGGWNVVTNENDLHVGDIIVIAESTKGYVMTSSAPATGTLGAASVTINNGQISSLPDSAIQLTLGGQSGAWTLQNSAGKYLKVDETNNSRHLAFQDSESTFNITISDDNATIGGTVRILLNSSANPERFSTYSSDLSASMLLPELYKLSGVYQIDKDSDLITAIDGFYSTNPSDSGSKFVCDSNGANFDVIHWNNNSALAALKTKYELNKIVADPNGNKVEQFLAMYDYVIGTKKIELGIAAYSSAEDFLGRFSEGGIHYNPANPMLNKNGVSNNTAVIATTIIISVISVSTLCGYFLLRKRKEEK